MTGKSPFSGDTPEALFQDISEKDLPQILRPYSSGLLSVVMQMLDKDPSSRITLEQIRRSLFPVVDLFNFENLQQLSDDLRKKGFILHELILQTTSCKVFRANFSCRDVQFALKVVCSSDTDSHRQHFCESNVRSKLNHSHIIPFCDYRIIGNNDILRMTFVGTETLRDFMNSHKSPIPESTILLILEQLCSALQHIHKHYIVHLDLNPDSILISDDLNIMIWDFDIARKLSSDFEDSFSPPETTQYMAPEFLYKKGYSFSSDIWSIGCIIFEMMTGSPPSDTITHDIFERKLSQIGGIYSQNLIYVVMRMLDVHHLFRANIQGIQELLFSASFSSHVIFSNQPAFPCTLR